MHTPFCVCPPRVESLFPPVLLKSCNQFPLGFKVWFSRNSSSHGQTPRLGCLTWGSETLLQWVDFCGISVLQSVSHPPSSYRIWFYCDCTLPTISLWLLLCLWMWGIFFGEFQCLPVNDCPGASYDSGVLTRESESTSFYSAILVPPPRIHIFHRIFENNFHYNSSFHLKIWTLIIFRTFSLLYLLWSVITDSWCYYYNCFGHLKACPCKTVNVIDKCFVFSSGNSPISLPLLGLPCSLRHSNIEIRLIYNPTMASKRSSERKSCASLTLHQKLEMIKLGEESR